MNRERVLDVIAEISVDLSRKVIGVPNETLGYSVNKTNLYDIDRFYYEFRNDMVHDFEYRIQMLRDQLDTQNQAKLDSLLNELGVKSDAQ